MKTIILSITIFISTMEMTAQRINPFLNDQIKSLEQEIVKIEDDRKKIIFDLEKEIISLIEEKGEVNVTFVCTHNSRRSQLAELWFRAATQYHNIDHIKVYSGGTEATAFNPRMVDAVVRFGFTIEKSKSGENPKYIAKIGSEDINESIMFSKKFDDPFNPAENFIAVMVCSDADKNCPVVPGAYSRIALMYEDPKKFDDTESEKEAYDAKVREIGREILYLASLLKDKNFN